MICSVFSISRVLPLTINIKEFLECSDMQQHEKLQALLIANVSACHLSNKNTFSFSVFKTTHGFYFL